MRVKPPASTPRHSQPLTHLSIPFSSGERGGPADRRYWSYSWWDLRLGLGSHEMGEGVCVCLLGKGVVLAHNLDAVSDCLCRKC